MRRVKPGFPRTPEVDRDKVYNDTRCDDCGYETNWHGRPKSPYRSEWYIVNDAIWKKATSKRPANFLCIVCLERRIDRVLTPRDFPTSIPGNLIWQYKSPLLRNRMGQ